ncbi:hypothetical protein ACEQPO_09350 [Bacillus sp. SL00103]
MASIVDGDNVVAMASRALSNDKRNKAIWIGTLLAVLMRIDNDSVFKPQLFIDHPFISNLSAIPFSPLYRIQFVN